MTSPRDVTIGMISAGLVDHHTVASLVLLQRADAANNRRVEDAIFCESGPLLWYARNNVMSYWLENKRSNWLLWIDADVTFHADALDQLLAVADPTRRAIIGGLCPAGGHGATWDDGSLFRSTMLLADPTGIAEDAPVRADERSLTPLSIDDALAYSAARPVRVNATGCAFLLLHRDVAEAVGSRWAGETQRWFAPAVTHGATRGEDVTFCLRAAACGYATWVHGGVQIGHRKTETITVDGCRSQTSSTSSSISCG